MGWNCGGAVLLPELGLAGLECALAFSVSTNFALLDTVSRTLVRCTAQQKS